MAVKIIIDLETWWDGGMIFITLGKMGIVNGFQSSSLSLLFIFVQFLTSYWRNLYLCKLVLYAHER